MIVLGFDVATKTGWCCIRDGKIEKVGDFRADAAEAKDREAQRILQAVIVYRTVREIVLRYRLAAGSEPDKREPCFVAIEAPAVMMSKPGADGVSRSNPNTDGMLREFNTAAFLGAVSAGARVERVHAATHRKAFLGFARAPAGQIKKRVLEECRRRGIRVGNLDQSDAVSVAHWGAGRVRMVIPRSDDLFAISQAAE